jgi:PAS domain S-box-containing protein
VTMKRTLGRFAARADRERREKSALLESTGEGIVGVDARGRVGFANPMAARMLGYGMDELVGWRVSETMERGDGVEDGGRALHEMVAETVRTGEGRRDERLTLTRKDGSPLIAACGVFPVHEGDAVSGAVINFLDVTPRHRAEQERSCLLEREQSARREAEAAGERARFLSDASRLFADSLDYETTLQNLAHLVVTRLADSCLIYLCDADGGVQRLEPAHRDPRARALLQAQLRLHPPTLQTLIPPVRDALREGKTTRLGDVRGEELKGVPGDDAHLSVSGTVGLGSLVVVPLIARGRILGAISCGATESGRLGTPEELLLVEELANRAALAIDNAELYRASQDAVRTREEVLGVVSHDLRSPLNAVRFGAQALLRHWPEATRATAEHRQVEAISRAADRMARMVSDLLDIARIDSRTLSIEPAAAEVDALLRETVAAHEAAAGEKGVSLVTHVEPDLPEVLIDEQRIQQVLANLVTNALRFTPEGGRITLRAERHDARTAVFTVTDTGHGISTEHLPRLFDRFWKSGLDRSSTGLGLSIARGIVESHGGTIRVDSQPGLGSSFSFTVPVVPGEPASLRDRVMSTWRMRATGNAEKRDGVMAG